MSTRLGHAVAVALFASAFAGCSNSHGRGDDAGRGVPCGPTTCAVGEVCCNASCGICTAPGEGCIDIACVDGGSGPLCGGSVCEPGAICCSGCPGDPDFCVSGSLCPDFDCPPPPPGCEACGLGQTCCDGCPGTGSFCVDGAVCPDLVCPPPPECDGDASCPAGFFCDHFDGCGGPGACIPLPTGCTADCPGVCGCDGTTYCNGCDANAAGVDVAHTGTCDSRPCEGRSYCDCSNDPSCAPLIDTSNGCVCPCDDPFNCTGMICDCGCGGAQYRGCTDVGRCPMTEVSCGVGCEAIRSPDDGCLLCVCAVPG